MTITLEKPIVNLNDRKKELRKSLPDLKKWTKKQTNQADKSTDFIYNTYTYEELKNKIAEHERITGREVDKKYALNRWFNWLTSDTVENILTSYDFIHPEENEKHPTIDIHMDDLRFPNSNRKLSSDVKLSVFPQRLLNQGRNVSEFKNRKGKNELIQWFYENQSSERRFHTSNRLFVVVHSDKVINNYEIKTNFDLIQKQVDKYINYIKANPKENINIVKFEVFNKKKKKYETISVYSDVIMVHI